MSILVLGGAGYIGSHMVRSLIAEKMDVVVLDNLQSGHKQALPPDIRFYEGDIRDGGLLDRVFLAEKIQTVIHFAANSLVGESMQDPAKYYDNNVGGAICLVDAMRRHGVKQIVFSSTAAVYGEPQHIPIQEEDQTLPKNPYGETKLAMERLFYWADEAYGIRYVSLRYFNACGAQEGGYIGEDHTPETHLIPLVLQVANGQRAKISVFGADYPTEDGTCIRDYIHVCDLANAHILAAKYLQAGEPSTVFNLGNGVGFSVREVIESARKVTGHPILSEDMPRREGDPAVLIASNKKAKDILGWNPCYTELEQIIETAWQWHQSHPNGYRK